jgi:UPF0755 protein
LSPRGNRSQPAHERTAEERERDRIERERRRAERSGAPSADLPPAPAPAAFEQPRQAAPSASEPLLETAPDEQAPASSHPDDDEAGELDDLLELEEMPPSGAGLAGHALPESLPVAPQAAEADVLAQAAEPPSDAPGEVSSHSAAPLDDPHATQAFDVLAEPLEPDLGPVPAAGSVGPSPERFAHEPQPPDDDAEPYSHDDAGFEHEPDELAPPLPPLPSEAPRRMVRIGTDRVASYAPVDAGGPPRGRARRAGGADAGRSGGGGAGAGHRRVTRARVAALVALALAAALVWFLISLFQPFSGGAGSGRVIVVIPKGASSSKIGSILAHDEVVASGFFFNLRATLDGKRGSLHSGRFELEHGMSYSAAIDALSKPPPKAIVVKLVIPEGYTRRQIAQLVKEDALSGDYLTASKRSAALNPRDYGAPARTPDLEGFLFPATYEVTAGAPVTRLVDEQLAAFEEHFTSADKRRARELHVTPYQLLTVASMIEREAQTAGDRPKIAAVIYNRLREGIPLGIDATIYYAVEEQKGIATYTGELTDSQLKIDSPYNTRTHKGLPPTPISNPGVASIEAAAHPAHVPYLYYVAGADGCGEQVFSRTEAEFEKNVAAYDAAVKKNGGRPPTCKKK